MTIYFYVRNCFLSRNILLAEVLLGHQVDLSSDKMQKYAPALRDGRLGKVVDEIIQQQNQQLPRPQPR